MYGEHGPVLSGTYPALAFHIREGKEAEIGIGIDCHQQYHQVFGYFNNQIGHKPHSTPRLKCPLVKVSEGASHIPAIYKGTDEKFIQYLFLSALFPLP